MAKRRIIRQRAVTEPPPQTEAPLLVGGQVQYPEEEWDRPGRHARQTEAINYAASCLELLFRQRKDVYLGVDEFIYYREGRPEFRVKPDMFVAVGELPDMGLVYKLWEAGAPPQFALDVLGGGEPVPDLEYRRDICRRLGVLEYWRFDALGGLLREPGRVRRVMGERLTAAGQYDPIRPGPSGWPCSGVIGLELREEDGRLRLWDPVTEKGLKYYAEWQAEIADLGRQAAEERSRWLERQKESEEHCRARKVFERRAAELERRTAELRRRRLEVQEESEEICRARKASEQRAAEALVRLDQERSKTKAIRDGNRRLEAENARLRALVSSPAAKDCRH